MRTPNSAKAIVLAGLITTFINGCNVMSGMGQAGSSDSFPVQQSQPLITKEEGVSLLAFVSISERKLYVTDQDRLQSVLARGFWPALSWNHEQNVAFLRQPDDEDIELFIEFILWSRLLTREAEQGDVRFLEEFRKKDEMTARVFNCRNLTSTHNGRQVLAEKFARVRYTRLIDPGDVMAPEFYSDTLRDYLYAAPGCGEYVGHTSHVTRWIIERGPWPNP